jgi:hypothetical protein
MAVNNTCTPGPNGGRYGRIFMMNKRGNMMINFSADTIKKLSAVLNKLIKSDEEKKIVRSIGLQIAVDAPADQVQQMLNIVGETYMAKRNEKAQKQYQTDYTSLNKIQQAEIDKLVPILVHERTMNTYSDGDKKRFSSVTFNAPSVSRNQLPKKITDEVWEKTEKELAVINNREISYNGKASKIKDVFNLLQIDTKANVKLNNRYKVYDDGALETSLSLAAPAIDPKNPEYYYVLDGKWVYSIGLSMDLVKSIDTYTAEQAVKRYGKKAKNGAIAVTSSLQLPRIDIISILDE